MTVMDTLFKQCFCCASSSCPIERREAEPPVRARCGWCALLSVRARCGRGGRWAAVCCHPKMEFLLGNPFSTPVGQSLGTAACGARRGPGEPGETAEASALGRSWRQRGVLGVGEGLWGLWGVYEGLWERWV